jgi:DNA-binding SARP family transcriptional activator/tetratricopeptide (TPR) repeat protein
VGAGGELEFGLLGPLQVRRGGVAVPVAPGMQRSLLAALLLRGNAIVPVGELAEVLWGAEVPPSALASLRNVVLRLRRSLGAAGHARIVAEPSGYRIRVEPGELDVDRFEALLGAARDAGRAGSHADVAGLLREALECWRGQPLAGVPSELLAVREVPRLEEMRLQALEARIDADVRLGRHAEVIVELRQLAAAHPLRERLHVMLMLALYRDGQRAGALAVYQAARRVLREELGAEPGDDLARLQQQILAGQPAASGPAEQAAVRAGAAGRDTQPAAAREPAAPAAAGSQPASGGESGQPSVVPRQLPAAVPYFTGRAGELAELTQMLSQPEVAGTVVISAIAGTAGIGKTALALHWAHQAAGHFPDGQLYVNLQGFGPSGAQLSPSAAVRLFLDGLGVTKDRMPASLDAQAALYRSLLAGRRVLILLDNARDSAQVRPLLPGSPGCLVLVTSRDQLTGLAAADAARVLILDVLAEPEAREMLALRIGEARLAAELEVAAELTGLCARLPLALSIVAARAVAQPGLSLAALADEVRAAGARLDALGTGDAATDLRTVLSWSVRQLSELSARMFRLISIHPGPDITVPAAASLAALPRLDAEQVLRDLARAHLISEHRAGRFAFHDLLRAYSLEQAAELESDAERSLALHRLLDHYLHSASNAAQLLSGRDQIELNPPQPGVRPEDPPDPDRALAWFRAERQVLLAVIQVAADSGCLVHAWQLPWAISTFMNWYGYWHEFVWAQARAVAAAEQLGDLTAQAEAHRYLGLAWKRLDANDEAGAHFTAAAELAAEAGNDALQAMTYFNLAGFLESQGDFSAALRHSERAGHHFRTAGNPRGQAIALSGIGWLHAQLGSYHQALDVCHQALEIFRELRVQEGQAATLHSLGYAHVQLGQYAEAISCYQQASELDQDVGDQSGRAEIFIHLGDAHEAAGNLAEAIRAWKQALGVFSELGEADTQPVRTRLARHAACATSCDQPENPAT